MFAWKSYIVKKVKILSIELLVAIPEDEEEEEDDIPRPPALKSSSEFREDRVEETEAGISNNFLKAHNGRYGFTK